MTSLGRMSLLLMSVTKDQNLIKYDKSTTSVSSTYSEIFFWIRNKISQVYTEYKDFPMKIDNSLPQETNHSKTVIQTRVPFLYKLSPCHTHALTAGLA